MAEIMDWVNVFIYKNKGGLTPNADAVKSCLVIHLGHIGDIIHLQPLLTVLSKESFRVTLLHGNWTRGIVDVYQSTSGNIVLTPSFQKYNRGLKSVCSFMRELHSMYVLRKTYYTYAICCSTDDPYINLLALSVRASLWLGTERGYCRYSYPCPSELIPYTTVKYESLRLLEIISTLGVRYDKEICRLQYPVNSASEQWICRLLSDHNIPDPYILAAPGAGWFGKMWPADRFGEVCRYLALLGYTVVVIGGDEERELCERVHHAANHHMVKILPEVVPLTHLGALLARAELLICNDSALLHIAVAVNTPTVSLWGPSKPSQWAPRNSHRHHIIKANSSCHGCFAGHPEFHCKKNSPCIDRITVNCVTSEVGNVLERAASRNPRL